MDNVNQVKITNKISWDRLAWFYFIMCIMVAMTHCVNTDIFFTEKIDAIYHIQINIAGRLGAMIVAGFFIVSGILFFRGFDIKQLPKKWGNRVTRLLVPYLIWNAIYSLYSYLMANIPFLNRFADEKQVSIKDFLLGIIDCDKYNVVFWYIKYLMLFCLMAPVIYYAVKNIYIGGIMLLGIELGLVFLPVIDAPSDYVVLLFWSFFFVLGAYIGIHKGFFESLSNKLGLVPQTVISLLLYAGATLMWLYVKSPLEQVIRQFYCLMLVYLVWNISGFIKKTPISLTGCTFFIYASHWLIARNYNKLMCVIFGTDMKYGALAYFSLPIFVLLLVYIIYRLLGKTWLWKVLNGKWVILKEKNK